VRRHQRADIHSITGQAAIYLSPVNVAEIRFGIELMTHVKKKQRAMGTCKRLRRKPLLRVTAETGETFGVIAAKLTKLGRSADFRIQDLWLAAQAVERNYTLLTANSKDFMDVPGLKVIEVPIPR